jgi:hypothetical protein
MPPPQREKKRERQPWTGAPQQPTSLASRPIKRAAAAGVGVLLLAAFAWLVWYVVRPAPRLVAAIWTAGDYDPLSAPPLPFARQSLDEFRRQVADDSISRDAATPQTDGELIGFCGDVKGYQGGSRKDLLVAFVVAHGVSVLEPARAECDANGGDAVKTGWQAVPYLLCSNYQPGQASDGQPSNQSSGAVQAGMVPLDALIDALRECPVGQKLLLLDWGSVESEPALGMVVNEFPKLLAEKVAATNDRSLWVLVSHSVGQRSLADQRKKSTVFARCMNQALLDYAGRQDAGETTLADLAGDVTKNVEREADRLTDGALAQRPVLLWGGGKPTDQGVPVLPRIPKPPSAPEGPDAGTTAATAGPVANAVGNARHGGPYRRMATGQTLALLGPQAPPYSPAPSSPVPVARSRVGLPGPPPTRRASQSVASSSAPSSPAPSPAEASQADAADKKQQDAKPSGPDGSKPAQAKPKQKEQTKQAAAVDNWTRQWTLCDDRMAGDESGWTPVDFAPRAWRDYCERLVAAERRADIGQAGAPAGSDESTWPERATVFVRQAARYEQHEDIVSAVRLRNDLLFRLPYHLQWMTAGASSVDDDDLDAIFPAGLFDALAGIIQSLAAPPRTGGAEAASDVARWCAELRRHSANLQPFKQRLEQRLADEIKDLTNPKSASADGGDVPRIETLLGIPLFTAPERAKLRARLLSPLPADQRAAGARPANVLRRAELEWRLWHVVDPATAEADKDHLDRFKLLTTTNLTKLVEDGRSRDELRALAALKQDAYYRLATNLLKHARATDDTKRLADAALRLIDGRRAGKILESSHEDPVNDPLLPELGIAHPIEVVRLLPAGGQTVGLELGKPSVLSWSVRHQRRGQHTLTWWLSFDDRAEDLGVSVDGRPVVSGQPHKLTLNRGEERTELRCTVMPRREADRGLIEITLHVEGSEAPAATDKIAVSLPRRQPLRFDVAPRGGAAVSALDHATMVELRPFFSPQPPDEPRPTRFRLSLANDAPLSKQVMYKWFALPPGQDALRRAREGDDIAALCRGLATTDKPQTISAGGELSLDVPFPKPAAPAPDTANAGNTANAGAPPPAPRGHDIVPGLVLDVIEVEVKADGSAPTAVRPPQRFLIQVDPKHPKEYLTPPTVVYSPSDRRLNIAVEATEADALPPEGSKIVWEIGDQRLKTAADKKTVAKLTSKTARDTMYARLPPKPDKPIEVWLTVDGYPRAFAYDVPCDEVDHAPSQNKLEFLKQIELQVAGDGDSAEADAAAAGPLRLKNVPSLQVRLRADAPREWFQRPNHRIEVGLETSDGLNVERELTADRIIDIRAAAGEAAGDWEILATVSDIELTLDTEGRADSRFDVVARLVPEPSEQRRTVILDGLAPELHDIDAELAGAVISASVLAGETSDSQSGVNRVEFAVLKSADWKAKQGSAPATFAQPEPATLGADGRWSAEIKRPTEPGNYVVLARAIDNAGNESEVSDYPLAIAKPRDAKGPAGDGKNSLIGSFTVRGAKPDSSANWRVSLKGPKSVGPVSANAGRYSFKGLPPGKYELTIKGDFGKTETWGPKEITIEAPPAKPTVDRWDLGSDDGQAK